MHILSMLFITFRFLLLNAFNILPNYLSLSCSSISHDGSLVAGGFSDSSLKVYFFIFPLAPFHEPFWKQTLFQWSFILPHGWISELYLQVWDMAKLGQQPTSCEFLFVNFFCLDQAMTLAFFAWQMCP